ncbi:MAG: ATP-binding region ATPase domain protein [Firmicutes bacterium]|nr:ATP-binding region ATPase domain protein [Bacillota bacterium]
MGKHNESSKGMQITNPSAPEITNTIVSEWAASSIGSEDLFDNLPYGCVYYKIVFNEERKPIDLKYIKVNAAYEKNMGYPLDKLIGNHVTEVFSHWTEKSLHWMETYIEVALSSQPAAFTQYLEHQDKWYSIYAYSPQRGWIVEITENITELKKTEFQKTTNLLHGALIEKVTALGTLATVVANEINQPLQTLKIMADGMVYWYEKGKETKIEKIIGNCRHISVQAGYISAIVEWMQDSVNKAWSDTPEEVDLNTVIKRALMMVHERVRSHSIHLREKICVVSPRVWGDSRRLEEIVIIILVNAIEALDSISIEQTTKEIVVITTSEDNKGIIEISNNGPMIPNDIIGKIFEPFFSSSQSGAKLGMGLAIAKSIVNAHNGTIQVACVNQQVTFHIEIPLYVPTV